MNKENKKIIIFAAGTGGHVYPGLSIANELMRNNISVLWIGTEKGIEKIIIGNSKIPIKYIQFSGIRGKGIFSYIKLPYKLIKSIIQSFKIIMEYKPNIVLSMGGYISFPCVIASFILRIPIIIHEQNIIFGLSNNILRFLSNKVILGFPMQLKDKKYKYLGNPTRYEELKKNKKIIKKDKINILIIGGSLGAKVFNEIVPQAIYILKNNTNIKINILHQTGKTLKVAEIQYNHLDINVDLREYIDSMDEAYNWCDIIVCRGGAITISEIMCLGIPAIIIPYPHAADDHQMKNAKFLEKNNAAVVIDQKNFNAQYLESILKKLIDNIDVRKSLSKNIVNLNQKNSTINICKEITLKINSINKL